MWLARCDYIQKLRPPRELQRLLSAFWNRTCRAGAAADGTDGNLGTCRFAFERGPALSRLSTRASRGES